MYTWWRGACGGRGGGSPHVPPRTPRVPPTTRRLHPTSHAGRVVIVNSIIVLVVLVVYSNNRRLRLQLPFEVSSPTAGREPIVVSLSAQRPCPTTALSNRLALIIIITIIITITLIIKVISATVNSAAHQDSANTAILIWNLLVEIQSPSSTSNLQPAES